MQKMTTLALITTYERFSASAENGDFGKNGVCTGTTGKTHTAHIFCDELHPFM